MDRSATKNISAVNFLAKVLSQSFRRICQMLLRSQLVNQKNVRYQNDREDVATEKQSQTKSIIFAKIATFID